VNLAQSEKPAGHYRSYRQDGVALAILVWFVAAMSLLVAGIVMQARVDIKLAQLHIARARAEAVADGAIQLALAQLQQPVEQGDTGQQVLQGLVYQLGGLNVRVDITPLSGLINLNQASEELLYLLFLTVDGLGEGAARQLAFNVVEWRTPGMHSDSAVDLPAADSVRDQAPPADPTDPDAPSNRRFEANEDLLLVAGVDRRVYEAVQDAIYVSQEGQAGVDWATAPPVVLRGLMGGDAEAAQALAESRLSDAQEGLVAPSDIDLSFQEARIKSSYRIDAAVELDGSVFNRRRWADSARPGTDGFPWSFFRTESLRVLPAVAGAGMTMAEGDYAGS
jgi:general secretion pathway protein K